MILVDTSVIVVWLDRDHAHHKACTDALDRASQADGLGISTVTKVWAGLDWIWP
ncbi:MAG: PIN domain-containing protein [Limisphaerales bacterium]